MQETLAYDTCNRGAVAGCADFGFEQSIHAEAFASGAPVLMVIEGGMVGGGVSSRPMKSSLSSGERRRDNLPPLLRGSSSQWVVVCAARIVA